MSTEILPVTSKRAVGRKTILWLSYHDRHWDPLLDGLSANRNYPETAFWEARDEALGELSTILTLKQAVFILYSIPQRLTRRVI